MINWSIWIVINWSIWIIDFGSKLFIGLSYIISSLLNIEVTSASSWIYDFASLQFKLCLIILASFSVHMSFVEYYHIICNITIYKSIIEKKFTITFQYILYFISISFQIHFFIEREFFPPHEKNKIYILGKCFTFLHIVVNTS